MPSRLCASLATHGVYLWMRLGVFQKLLRVVGQGHVIGLRGEYGNVLRAVVGLVMVNVMYALAGQKEPAQLGLGHKAMLIDIAVAVGGWMIWSINVNVPALVCVAPALPIGTVWPLASIVTMTATKTSVFSFVDAAISMVAFGNRGNLPTTALAKAIWVRFLLHLPTGMIHLFGRFGPGPVASNVAMPFGNLCTTTA